MKAYLEPGEVALLEGAATNLRDRLLIRVLARTGCRISEALALTVEDIDPGQCTVTIQHLKTWLKLSCSECNTKLGQSHSFCPKCAARVGAAVAQAKEHRKRRVLPLDKDTVGMLRAYVEQGGPIAKDGRLMLFGISSIRAWQVVRDAARRAGLERLINPETGRQRGVSPHRLRDAFATHAAGMDSSPEGLKLLQEQLGHHSMDQTARYIKVATGKQRGWYERLWQKTSE